MSKKIVFFIVMSLFFACKQEVKNTQGQNNTANGTELTQDSKKIVEDIMKVHDEVMPMMGKIEALEKALKLKLENTKSVDAKKVILDQLMGLEKADKAMYAWMDGFKTDYTGMNNQQVVDYLNGEKNAVTKMAEEVKTAIANAEK